MDTQTHSTAHVGWAIPDWCAAVSISRSALYTMSPEIAPRSISLGRRRIIVESPGDWLRRIAERDPRAVA